MDTGNLTDFDLHLIAEGTHYRLYEKLGAHPGILDSRPGTYFRVWAPNAQRVSVQGDFNGWNRESNPMQCHGETGIWACFIPGVVPGNLYKYYIVSY